MRAFAEFLTRISGWMLNYSSTEVVVISLAILALAILLLYIGVRLIDVMIFGEDDGE